MTEDIGGVAVEEQQPLAVAGGDHENVHDGNGQRDTALTSSPPRINPPSPPGHRKLIPSTPTFSIK